MSICDRAIRAVAVFIVLILFSLDLIEGGLSIILISVSRIMGNTIVFGTALYIKLLISPLYKF